MEYSFDCEFNPDRVYFTDSYLMNVRACSPKDAALTAAWTDGLEECFFRVRELDINEFGRYEPVGEFEYFCFV